MLCNQCNERPATIHLNFIVGDKITKRDLCEVCGKEFADPSKFRNAMDLRALVAGGPEQMIYELMGAKSGYAKEAYQFVQEGINKAQKMFSKPGTIMHISGTQLLEALRQLAIEKFGKQAKATLNGWGIFKCDDFGEMVFNLVEARLLAKQDTDSMSDFQGGYDFDVAFPS